MADVIQPADLVEARHLAQGWRLRLAVLRSRKREATGALPLAEDLRALELAGSP